MKKTKIITLKITYDEDSLKDQGHDFDSIVNVLTETFGNSEYDVTIDTVGKAFDYESEPKGDWIDGFYTGEGT